MAFRIQHKPTGRFLKKRSSITTSIGYVLGRMDKYYPREVALQMATTDGVGHLYATRKNAEETLKILTVDGYDSWFKGLKKQPNDWEIVEG